MSTSANSELFGKFKEGRISPNLFWIVYLWTSWIWGRQNKNKKRWKRAKLSYTEGFIIQAKFYTILREKLKEEIQLAESALRRYVWILLNRSIQGGILKGNFKVQKSNRRRLDFFFLSLPIIKRLQESLQTVIHVKISFVKKSRNKIICLV